MLVLLYKNTIAALSGLENGEYIKKQKRLQKFKKFSALYVLVEIIKNIINPFYCYKQLCDVKSRKEVTQMVIERTEDEVERVENEQEFIEYVEENTLILLII